MNNVSDVLDSSKMNQYKPILLSMIKVVPNSLSDVVNNLEDVIYSNQYLINKNKEICWMFDYKKWEAMFIEGNKIYLMIEKNNSTSSSSSSNSCCSCYYALHISFFPSITPQTDFGEMNEKDTMNFMIRNSRRILFNFCMENAFDCKWSLDSKSKKHSNPNIVVPGMADLCHHEFLNRTYNETKKVYINCTKFSAKHGHLKLITDKEVHWLTGKCKMEKKLQKLTKNWAYLNICNEVNKKEIDDTMYKQQVYVHNPHYIYSIDKKKKKRSKCLDLEDLFENKMVLNIIQIYK